MADESVAEADVDARFSALRDAAGDGPDWLAAAAADRRVRRRLDALAAAVSADGDRSLAAAYQRHLSADAQAANGHFATDPAIAAALCRWAIRPRPDGRPPRVLDPATGSGVFAAAALDRLRAVGPERDRGAPLSQVVGVDRDPAALALTAHRLLEAAGTGAGTPRLYEADFFDVEPGGDRAVTVADGTVRAGRFDAVVGNPPYVRQEAVDADRVRAHLAAFGPDGESPYRDGDRAISERSDAYVYFLTQATRFLRDGGRLGVVVPKKWLATRYGESVRRFLADHYRLHGVVGFGARAFDDALVDAVLLFAERCRDADRRRETPVRFCRLDEQVSVSALLSILDPDDSRSRAGADESVTDGDGWRRATVRQGALPEREGGTLAPYLDAPWPFVRLLSNPNLGPLGALATISRGVMTGANDFFFLSGPGPGEAVPDRFRAPAIKSVRDVDDRIVTAADTDRALLDVHDYVEAVAAGRSSGADGDLAGAVRESLARDGHDGLLEYLAWGERQGYHERKSCAARPVWFDLGAQAAPAVFAPKFFDERVHAIANPDGLLASNAVDCLWPADGVDERVLQGILDSTVTAALLECWGRAEGGGALQVMTYELRTLPVPDPRGFDQERRAAIADAVADLLAGEPSARRRLDELVLEGIGCDLPVATCRRLRERMVRRRVDGGKRAAAPLTVD
ncbi:MAG: class I SAM-dependent DNA methyltransferase [Haloarculaceae archaeon]